MFTDMEQWSDIRRRVLIEGASKRQILRETGLHWKTLKKILENSTPPGYRQAHPRVKKKLGPYVWRIEQILKEDKAMPKKQRHTAKKIFERLRKEGYEGGYTVVKEAVREMERHHQEVFVPLSHPPGEAQVDFGYALVRMNGTLRKVAFFVMALPYSDVMFVMAFERECTETFWEGHVRAFEFFGGVPRKIVYDNTRVAVGQIVGGKGRKLTAGFCQLKSHYLFNHRFCQVRRPNEKGVVEGTVKFARLNYFVPVPQVRDFEVLNAHLHGGCQEDQERRVRGKAGNKKQLLEEDRTAFLSLPVKPFEACRQQSTAASSISLVRFDDNDYSVPVAYAHHMVVVKGYCDEVVVSYLNETVTRHRRIWEREQVSFDPLHYLAILERKPGALDQARPLQGWTLPECFEHLRRRLEAEYEHGEGTREYIRVLRLLEKHPLPALRRAVEKGLSMGAIRRDAIAQFLFPQEEWRATQFTLDGHSHLRAVRVQSPDIMQYSSLLAGGVR
jgi:transposase